MSEFKKELTNNVQREIEAAISDLSEISEYLYKTFKNNEGLDTDQIKQYKTLTDTLLVLLNIDFFKENRKHLFSNLSFYIEINRKLESEISSLSKLTSILLKNKAYVHHRHLVISLDKLVQINRDILRNICT